MKKVLILGSYDFDNLGDDYMMYHVKEFLKRKDIKAIFLKRNNRRNYFEINDVEFFEYPVLIKYKNKIKKIIEILKWYVDKKNIKGIDSLIFMGGGYINEEFGLFNLLSFLLIEKKFKKLNKKIYFTGQTVGPVKSFIYKLVLKKIYKNADKIFVREIYSKNYLNKLKIHSDLVGDDAFLTDNTNVCKKENRMIFNYKDFKGYDKYKQEYFDFLLNLAKESKKEIIVLPFRSSETSKEYKINYELYELLIKNGVNAKFIVERNIEKFKNIFATSELTIGTAYHSIVIGLIFNNIVYSTYIGDYYKMKIKGILNWYDYDDNNSLDIKKLDSYKFLIKQIIKMNNDKNKQTEITKKIKDNVENAWIKIINEINSLGD